MKWQDGTAHSLSVHSNWIIWVSKVSGHSFAKRNSDEIRPPVIAAVKLNGRLFPVIRWKSK
ncbi:MAG TPA: hypothetical protein DEG90_09755 [Porphyromonadaceae bacterium]|nr:hypothetical protein [Porphyromonadaceae bacterium]